MKKALGLLLIIWVLTSCGHKTVCNDIVELVDNSSICDTCSIVIKIQHDECTDCADLLVDSGLVHVSNSILQKADSLITGDTLLQRHYYNRSAKLNLNNLLLADETTFNQLWPDTTIYSQDTLTFKNFNTTYVVIGKIVDIKVQKRMGFNVLTPIFKLEKIISRQRR